MQHNACDCHALQYKGSLFSVKYSCNLGAYTSLLEILHFTNGSLEKNFVVILARFTSILPMECILINENWRINLSWTAKSLRNPGILSPLKSIRLMVAIVIYHELWLLRTHRNIILIKHVKHIHETCLKPLTVKCITT